MKTIKGGETADTANERQYIQQTKGIELIDTERRCIEQEEQEYVFVLSLVWCLGAISIHQ